MRVLSPDLAVSPQIQPEDVATIAAMGYRSLICNRPDGEDHGQPSFATIAAAAAAAGMVAVHQPVVSGGVTPEDGAVFAAHLAALPGPVFAYCRSGARCASLFQLAKG